MCCCEHLQLCKKDGPSQCYYISFVTTVLATLILEYMYMYLNKLWSQFSFCRVNM